MRPADVDRGVEGRSDAPQQQRRLGQRAGAIIDHRPVLADRRGDLGHGIRRMPISVRVG
jgi:hypothetical protein